MSLSVRIKSHARIRSTSERATMIRHDYNGETFKVADSLTTRERDQACAIMVDYRNRARGDQGETYFEVDRMPEGSVQTPPKPRGRPRKVSAPISTGDAVEVPGYTSKGAKLLQKVMREHGGETITGITTEDALYAQGCYRVACATCHKGIPLTGKRGRAPKYHDSCRPVVA